MKKTDEGFTLIELLIVIVILGILATIVVFAVRGVTQDSQENACKSSQKTLQVAVEAWYASDPANKVDTNASGHPDGPDLVASQLMREYDAAGDVIVTEASPTSLVGPNGAGSCVGIITNS